jgi:hypothetical protein
MDLMDLTVSFKLPYRLPKGPTACQNEPIVEKSEKALGQFVILKVESLSCTISSRTKQFGLVKVVLWAHI